MGKRLVAFIFFANYFVGLLAVALSLETVIQLNLPFNSIPYYLLLASATVFYYTFAYAVPTGTTISDNPRTRWYQEHYRFAKRSQRVLLAVCIALAGWLLLSNFVRLITLPLSYWLLALLIPAAAILYYGLLPRSLIAFNLRNTGWLKAFVIGLVWAGCVSLFPVIMLKVERNVAVHEPLLLFWLFVKNWMFCTVNAIMFDIKDYKDDSNIELKTFAVRFGLHKTIYYILIPLLVIGMLSLFAFGFYRHFHPYRILFNLIPFVCLLLVAFSLQRPRSILFYLIVIDGLLLVKAACGIVASVLI